MNDMAAAIIPKSDQINADDLIAGPITIKITAVSVKSGEQPVSIFFDGDNGKPYKCCKSMARIMVAAWGPDSSKYVGRSLTLYRDPEVKWAGMAVGGIRISHMSDIPDAMTMALTATKGSRKAFTVRPLAQEKTPDYEAMLKAAATLDELGAVWKSMSKADKERFTDVKNARKTELETPPPDPSSNYPEEVL